MPAAPAEIVTPAPEVGAPPTPTEVRHGELSWLGALAPQRPEMPDLGVLGPDDTARIANAELLSQRLGLTTQEAHAMHDPLGLEWFEEDEPAPQRWGQIWREGWRAGQLQDALAEVGAQLRVDPGNEALLRRKAELEAAMPANSTQALSGLAPRRILRSIAEMAPMSLAIMSEGTQMAGAAGVGAAAVAAIAGQAPPLTAAPEELVTVPGAFLSAFAIGQTAGSYQASRRKMAGLSYIEFLNMRDAEGKQIPPEYAQWASEAIGTLGAIPEILQLAKIPGLNRLFGQSLSRAVAAAIQPGGSARRIVQSALLSYGANAGEQTAQEIVQNTIEKVGQAVVVDMTNRTRGTEFESQWDQVLPTAAATLEYLPVFLAIQAVGGTVELSTETMRARTPDLPLGPRPITEDSIIEAIAEGMREYVAQQETDAAAQRRAATQRRIDMISELPESALTPEVEGELLRLVDELQALSVGQGPPQTDVADYIFGLEGEDVEGDQIPSREVPPPEIGGPEALQQAAASERSMVDDGIDLPAEEKAYAAQAVEEALGDPADRPVPRRPSRDELAEAIPNVKTRVRIITGQRRIGDVVSEAKALRAQLRAEARAAREAQRSGIAQERERFQQLRAQERAASVQRSYIEKLARHVMRPAGRSIDFEYRQAIEAIQSGVDPFFRSDKTLRGREQRRAFLESKPEAAADMPTKLLQTLQTRSLNELRVSELEEMAQEVDRLRRVGSTKRRLQQAQRQRRFEEDRDQIIDNVLETEQLETLDEPVIASTVEEREPGRVRQAVQLARASTLRPPRIFDKLDGGQNFEGHAHEVFYNRENRAVNDELRAVSERRQRVRQRMEELGISLSDLSKTHVIAGHKYTLDEMLDIYAGGKNRRKSMAVIYGNNITDELIKKISARLTPEQRAFANEIILDYGRRRPSLRQAHIDFMDEDLGYEENYTPMRRTEVTYQPLEAQIRDEMLRKYGLQTAVERSFTKKRVDIPEAYQKPVRLGLYQTWAEQMPLEEHYISHAALVRDLNRLTHDEALRKAITQRYGKDYVEVIQRYVDRLANPNIYKSYGRLERFSATLRKHFAISRLAFNARTMLMQVPSAMLYLGDTSMPHLLAASLEFASNPEKLIADVRAIDPQMANRRVERELAELKLNNPGLYSQIQAQVGRLGFAGIAAMDTMATTIGWRAVYNYSIAQGLSEAEAMQAAQNATLRTQPAAHPKDLADIYTRNEVFNWVTQFSNQLNQIYNITTYDLPAALRNKQFRRAFLTTAALGANALLIWMVQNRRLPEDNEDLAKAQVNQVMNSIPVVGREVLSGIDGYWGSKVPPMEAITRFGAGAVDIKNGAYRRALKKFIESSADLLGWPYIGPERVLRFGETGDPLELVGKRRP